MSKKIVLCLCMLLINVPTVVNAAYKFSENWTINGIRLDRLSPNTEFVTGFLSSFVVHWLGHVVYLESNHHRWHQEGVNEFVESDFNSKEKGWMCRSGYLAQILVSAILPESDFGRGFNMGTLIETNLYRFNPFLEHKDTDRMPDDVELTIYSGISIYLNINNGNLN